MDNLEGFFGYFKTLENRIQELEKSQEKSKLLKTVYEKSQEELKMQIESLQKQVDELKTQNQSRPDEGLWLLTPLRGAHGGKGEKAELRLTESKGVKVVTESKDKEHPNQGISASQSVTSCSVPMAVLSSPRATKQLIYPHGNGSTKKVEVLCDFEVDGGGWTVIQKRSSGPREEFNRIWTEHVEGFGSLDGNFWLGLANIRALTENDDQELQIELEDFEGEKAYVKYSNFSISDASDFFRLAIGGYSGNVGDDMTQPRESRNIVNGMRFSTKDKDNDKWCGGNYTISLGGGGWWFNSCGGSSHLNGTYRPKGETFLADFTGIHWDSWKTGHYSLAKTEMKIRKRKTK